MSTGNTWYSWFSQPLFAPLSGAVTQDFRAVFGRGDPATEAEIGMQVGFGRQLGIISEALDDLIAKLEAGPVTRATLQAPGPDGEPSPIAKLRTMVKEVKAIKDGSKAAARKDAEDALARLKRLDPKAADDLLARRT